MGDLLMAPPKKFPDSEKVDLELVKEVKRLAEENRLNLCENFKSIDSLEYLNDLNFEEILKIMDLLED